MFNMFVLVGKLKEIAEYENSFTINCCVDTEKNLYEDIKVYTTTSIRNNLVKYAQVGGVMGIKGVIRGGYMGTMRLQANKVSYLSQRKAGEEDGSSTIQEGSKTTT